MKGYNRNGNQEIKKELEEIKANTEQMNKNIKDIKTIIVAVFLIAMVGIVAAKFVLV